MQHKGYNSLISGRQHQFAYNNTEYEKSFGLNLYEMPLRAFDPTIARWNRIDPVIHHSLSTYNAFDNNPVFYSDPSGGNSNAWLIDLYNSSGSGATTYSNFNGDFSTTGYMSNSSFRRAISHMNVGGVNGDPVGSSGNGDNNKEGQKASVTTWHGNVSIKKTMYYHAGDDASDNPEGWYTEQAYFELFRNHIRAIGQGLESFESLKGFGFTSEMHQVMVGWAVSAYSVYKGKVPLERGNINAMDFDSPIFILASLRSIGTAFLRSSTSKVPALRAAYETEVKGLSSLADKMRAAGNSSEEIARNLHGLRRELGLKYKSLTPNELQQTIYKRNIEKYGDKLGPTIDYLRQRGKSWDDIINSSMRSGGKDIKFNK